MEEKEYFKVQVATGIIRDNTLNHIDFFVYVKLLQMYGYQKSNGLEIEHKFFSFICNIQPRRLKESFKVLFDKKLILNEIISFPRKGHTKIILNEEYIPSKNKMLFTQLPYFVSDRVILFNFDHISVRIMYYYESYINRSSHKEFAYPAMETTIADIGTTLPTLDKYHSKLEKAKFIKIVRHDLQYTGEYVMRGDKEVLACFKPNNHYFIRLDRIEKYWLTNAKHIQSE